MISVIDLRFVDALRGNAAPSAAARPAQSK
jgi:hypothetical protein